MSISGNELALDPRAFSGAEYDRRLNGLRAAMSDRGLAAVVVFSPESIYYLAGLNHQGYFAFTMLVVPLEGEMTIVARRMESTTIAAQVRGARHHAFGDDEDPAAAAATALLDTVGPRDRVAFETDSMYCPVSVWQRMADRLSEIDRVDGSGLVAALRAIKSPEEITRVRRVARISSLAMAAGIEAVGSGVPETEVAAAVSSAMIRAGGEHPGFVPLIRSRDLLLHEHVSWHDRTIVPGDAMFMEFSASVGRYHAPISRMVYVETAPPGTDVAAGIAAEGLHAVREALVPGARSADVYAAWQRVVDAGLGHDRYRRHHCGYMVGIGFPPSWVGGSSVVGLRAGGDLEIREGMTFHVLSWLLDQKPADFVISDTVLVTADGGEILTDSPRDPIVKR